MLFAVVPAHDEQENIGKVVEELISRVDKVVVVDDGSADKTGEIALEKGAIVLRHELNRGQGAALATGHAYALRAGAEFLLHFDGDGQFDPDDIRAALGALKESQADILFGSRFLGENENMPFTKRFFILPAAKLFNRIFLGINLTDAHNGFRIFNRKALEILQISQDGMAHASEIPYLAKKLDLRIMEFPVKVSYHEYGQRLGSIFGIIRDLFMGIFRKKI